MTREMLDQARQAKAYLITCGGNKIVKQELAQADGQEERLSTPQAFATSNSSAQYRLQEFTADYEGHAVRLVVIESSALDKKKTHTLEKRVSQEHEQITEAMKAQGKIVFHCEYDAQVALGQRRADHPL